MVVAIVETGEKEMVTLVSRTGRHLQRYSSIGRRLVVGCIPYRFIEDETSKNCSDRDIEVLVISSQKGYGHGVLFPKGGWETDESMVDAASREALEEAGVRGDVQERLGKWSFKSKRYGTYYDGFMFPLLVKEQLDLWPEEHVRHRRWVTVAEARESCQQWWMKEALETLVNRLSNSVGHTIKDLTVIEKKMGHQLH
ncbi:nudix hydrolase 18, mitochondrial-like [Magnolia sinica]|uniref:nudix hydrolase 18, mitochondrial-like n=1 Tax=Magnolia sinica TaxID=86752 RepID=UPI002658C6DF|nr:nudix hydrolase 18, mitochondrial-like [Magnolia sinica]